MIALTMTSAATLSLGTLGMVQQRRLRTAHHDQLTGLADRRLWTRRAERALRKPSNLLLLLLDVDGLKQVNDRYGHDAGDALISAISQRLAAWTGGNAAAGRLGGDEFAAFLRLAASAPDLPRRLNALKDALSLAVPHDGHLLPASASIGVTVVSTLDHPTLRQALRTADVAMYLVKQGGGNAWRIADDTLDHHRRPNVASLMR
jgi:diguanylate cyclase (GGDEF)-like protein